MLEAGYLMLDIAEFTRSEIQNQYPGTYNIAKVFHRNVLRNLR